MLVNITGGNKHLRSLAHSLVEYCAEHLFSKNLKSKIILDIEFSKKLYKDCLLYTSPSPRDRG